MLGADSEGRCAMRMVWVTIALLTSAPAFAQTAGPPVPIEPKQSPAEQAISYAHRDDATPPPSPPGQTCRKADGTISTACGVKEGARPPETPCHNSAGEIVVCGVTGRSAERIPLPDERGTLAHPGEIRQVDVGRGPFPTKDGTTVARFGMGKAAKTRNATLKMIYEEEAAKQAAADAAKAGQAKVGTVAPPQ